MSGPATNLFFAFHYDNHKKALETTRKLAENSLGNHHLLFRLLCTGVIPFLYLSILNLLIYSRVRYWSNNLRNRLSWFTNSSSPYFRSGKMLFPQFAAVLQQLERLEISPPFSSSLVCVISFPLAVSYHLFLLILPLMPRINNVYFLYFLHA